jgi:hypothetical protein
MILTSNNNFMMNAGVQLIERQENGKRRRLARMVVKREKPALSHSLSLCELAPDVLVHILHFLPLDDLDNVATVSRRCSETRNHLSFDQTRTGTIIINRSMNSDRNKKQILNATTFLRAVHFRGWSNVFQGRRRRLRIEGLEMFEASKMTDIVRLTNWIQLKNVTTLDASFLPDLGDPQFRRVKNSVGKSLALMLPNLRELDISYMKVTETAVNAFAKHCPNLEVFRWNGSDDDLRLTGENLAKCTNLREIYLDGSRLHCSVQRTFSTPFFVFDEGIDAYLDAIQLLRCCSSKLERVSIKGVKWYSCDITMPSTGGSSPSADIPEAALIRFVATTPTLRWFRSDLSTVTVSRLRKEYPAISFC